MTRRLAGLCGSLFALLAASCDLSGNAEPARYLSILAPDSLLAYDTVLVMAMAPGTDSVLDTLWNAPLDRIDQLAKLPAGHYHGGPVDVLILGMKDGWAAFSLQAEYRGDPRPRIESSPPWDTLPPRLTLKGPDSSGFLEGQALSDTGAECVDEHPGAPRITVTGTVDPSRPGLYVLEYACRDRAGNVSRRLRKIRISPWPDSAKPVITLIGPGSPEIVRGGIYADAGAECSDDRDGNVQVTVVGGVDPARAGVYPQTYACADSAGNRADTVTRRVTVALPSDTAKPVIALRGPDSLPVLALAYFDDPGADCHDEADGTLPAAFTGFDPPSGPEDGFYRARYACADKSGNVAEAYRTVKAGLYSPNIIVTQDASIDTSIDTASEKYNMGYNGMLAMSMASGDRYVSLFQFDLSKLDKAGLKSAKIRFVTWARGNRLNWPGTAQDYTLRVWGLQRPWVEGSGNWFYHYGAWQNNGESWFLDYFLPAWVLNNSSNPTLKIGVRGSDRDLVRPENLTLIAARTVNAHFDASYAATLSMAPPRDLRVLEIDVTDYVKNADASRDHGFIVTAEGAPDRIGVLSREVSDGLYATRLMLSY
jgi:hypothetical protein